MLENSIAIIRSSGLSFYSQKIVLLLAITFSSLF